VTAIGDVAEPPAFLTLGAFRRGKHLLDTPGSGEEVDGGEDGESAGRSDCNNHRGGPLLSTRLSVWVKVTRRENGDSPGIAHGLMKRGKELVII